MCSISRQFCLFVNVCFSRFGQLGVGDKFSKNIYCVVAIECAFWVFYLSCLFSAFCLPSRSLCPSVFLLFVCPSVCVD